MQATLPDEIGTAIGTLATMRLLALFGGTRLYVPETMPDDHPIARAIGLPAAARLSAIFAREQLELPDSDEFHRLTRTRRVASLLRAGICPRDIAGLVGVSVKQVGRYRTEAEELGLLPLVLGEDPPADIHPLPRA